MPSINVNRFLEPPVHSEQVRYLLSSAAREGAANYPAACNLVFNAWVISILDSISYGTKLLTNATRNIITRNFENLVLQFNEDVSDYAESCKLNIALPVFIFFSIFYPGTLENLNYNFRFRETLRQEILSNLTVNDIPQEIRNQLQPIQVEQTQPISTRYPMPIERTLVVFQGNPTTYPPDIVRCLGASNFTLYNQIDGTPFHQIDFGNPRKVLFVVHHTARLESVNLNRIELEEVKNALHLTPQQVKIIAMTPGIPTTNGRAGSQLSTGESVETLWFGDNQWNESATNAQNMRNIYEWLRA